jgi:hypothetical protein
MLEIDVATFGLVPGDDDVEVTDVGGVGHGFRPLASVVLSEAKDLAVLRPKAGGAGNIPERRSLAAIPQGPSLRSGRRMRLRPRFT